MIIPEPLLEAQQAISGLYFGAVSSSLEAVRSAWVSLGLPDLDPDVLHLDKFAGVGIEFRRGADGQFFDDLNLVVYTTETISEWPQDDIRSFFPPPASNVAVSWRATGAFQPLAAAGTALSRPAVPGMSIGPDSTPVLAGTLGAVVQNGGGQQFILSCNHVLAPRNRSESPGINILQPSLLGDFEDRANDVIAKFTILDPLCVLQALPTISVGDFARAAIVDPALVRATTPDGMPKLASNKPLSPADFLANHSGKALLKFGGKTGLTSGKLTAPSADFTLEYDGFTAGFQQKYFVVSTEAGKPFAQPGDSGALVVTEDGFAVGLAFAIDQGEQGGPDTVVCSLDQLFNQLDLSFVIPN